MPLKDERKRTKLSPAMFVAVHTHTTHYVDRAALEARKEQEEKLYAAKDAQLDLVAAVVERDDPPKQDEPPRLHDPITVGEKVYDRPMVSFVVDGKALALVGVYDTEGKINDVNVVDPVIPDFLQVPQTLYANKSSVRAHFARCVSRLTDNDTIVKKLTSGHEDHAVNRGTELAKPINEESGVFHEGLVNLVQGARMLGFNDISVDMSEMYANNSRHGQKEQSPAPL